LDLIWTGATVAEIDLAEDEHAIILRCQIVMICKTIG
jgi:hypothetical protein